jgi:hypothetical protein
MHIVAIRTSDGWKQAEDAGEANQGLEKSRVKNFGVVYTPPAGFFRVPPLRERGPVEMGEAPTHARYTFPGSFPDVKGL